MESRAGGNRILAGRQASAAVAPSIPGLQDLPADERFEPLTRYAARKGHLRGERSSLGTWIATASLATANLVEVIGSSSTPTSTAGGSAS
jgi:hypothetical protein